jgi:hypothetical protein
MLLMLMLQLIESTPGDSQIRSSRRGPPTTRRDTDKTSGLYAAALHPSIHTYIHTYIHPIMQYMYTYVFKHTVDKQASKEARKKKREFIERIFRSDVCMCRPPMNVILSCKEMRLFDSIRFDPIRNIPVIIEQISDK